MLVSASFSSFPLQLAFKMDQQKKKLMEKCLKQLTSSRTSPILSEEKYARVMEVLQNPTACKDRNFKHWMLKMKQFQIMDLPGVGVKDALVVPIKDTKRTSSSGQSTSFLRIKLYKVATSVGLVKNAFSRGDLDAYSGTVHVNTDKLVSIRQTALGINSANRFTVNRCKCKGQCRNAQCSCIRSGILSSNHCHPGRAEKSSYT